MKVRVGEAEYDGDDTPIMVILDEIDQNNIKNLLSNPNGEKKYIHPPPHWTLKDIKKWIGIKND